MGMKAKITKTEHAALDEAVRKHYKVDAKDAETYHLEVEGRTPGERQALDVRDDLRKQMDALKEKFEGVDPEKYKELGEQVKALKKQMSDAKDDGKNTTDKKIAKLEATVAEERAARLKAEAAASVEQTRSAFSTAAGKAGVRPGVTTDMLWGAVRDTVKPGENGSGPTVNGIPIADHLSKLKETDGHLFAESQGANVRPSTGQPGSTPTAKPTDDYSAENHDAFQAMSKEQLEEYYESHKGDLAKV